MLLPKTNGMHKSVGAIHESPETNGINNRHGYKTRRRSDQAFPKEGKVAITLDEVDLQPLAVVVSDG